jgi:hypothetical protein
MAELGISRIVIWGIKAPFHSHHFIHLGFYSTLKNLNIPVLWLEDLASNQSLIERKDLVISVDVAMKFLKKEPETYYCIHNPPNNFLDSSDSPYELRLQVLTNDVYDANFTIGSCPLEGVAFYNQTNNILYQSWGTPLLKRQFFPVANTPYKKIEFFVGSVWDNDLGQGNLRAIEKYRNILKNFGIKFVQIKGAPEILNPIFVRNSALASSIVGEWQETHGYTPCRVFKAISYGRLGAINSISSQKQYPWLMANSNIDGLVSSILGMSHSQLRDYVASQQDFLSSETYESKLTNILSCFMQKAS